MSKKWTEAILQDAVEREFGSNSVTMTKGHACVVGNINLPGWGNESDMVTVTHSGYLWEFEMKISKADFQKDSMKARHQRYRLSDSRTCKKPNRFYYVMPAVEVGADIVPMVKAELIPSYAGLIGVYKNEDGIWAHSVKPAPLLHKEKVTIEQVAKMADVNRWRMWDWKRKAKALQAMVDGPGETQ